jgi:hypothetical protein
MHKDTALAGLFPRIWLRDVALLVAKCRDRLAVCSRAGVPEDQRCPGWKTGKCPGKAAAGGGSGQTHAAPASTSAGADGTCALH